MKIQSKLILILLISILSVSCVSAEPRKVIYPDLTQYVYDYGKETFEERGYSDVDALVFATIAYFPFQLLDHDSQVYTIRSAAEELLKRPDLEEHTLISGDVELLRACAQSRRYASLKVLDFIYDTDTDHDKQFCAVTFHITDDLTFVCFRGTDDSVVGWKEDFEMSFISPVSAQKDAADYLSAAMDKYPGSFVTCGHSKGGNLSLYAASFVSEAKQQRILEAYSFDGPGFPDQVLSDPGYVRMRSRMKLFVPKSSLVGMLLARDLECIPVDSSALTGVMQHDPYTWQISEEGEFILTEDIDEQARYFDMTFRSVLESLDEEEREELISVVFTLAEGTGNATVSEITGDLVSSTLSIAKGFVALDGASRKRLMDSIGTFAGSAITSLQVFFPEIGSGK